MIYLTVTLAILASLSHTAHSAWTKETFKNGIYFGDSYTDTGRGMGSHPVGWVEPENGGFMKNWPIIVKQLSGTTKHNYAISGASCSSKIINSRGMPDIKEKQIPAFTADLAFKKNGQPFMTLPAEDTIYAIWIGTNDLSAMGLLPMANGPEKVPQYVECVYEAYDKIYASGGRKFLLMNVIPLNLLPMYTLTKGQGADGLYPNKPATAEGLKVANKKLERMVLESNSLFANQSAAALQGAKARYPGAEIALYDVHKFVTEIYNNPKSCLTGANPDVKGFGFSESKMWGDALHPSPALGKCIAKEFVNVAYGTSKYATYIPAAGATGQ